MKIYLAGPLFTTPELRLGTVDEAAAAIDAELVHLAAGRTANGPGRDERP